MAYQIAEIVMTLSDLQGHSPTIACPSVIFFVQLSCRAVPLHITELLVLTHSAQCIDVERLLCRIELRAICE